MVKNVDNFDVNSISEKSPIGQKNLQFLMTCCQITADKYRIKVGDVKKLISNLGDKTNYVVQYRNLELYLSLEIKLTKVHKVLKLRQSDWMKIYMDFSTKKRKIVLKNLF